jgi:glycosyltransferase involved in cell wall biosynthesis
MVREAGLDSKVRFLGQRSDVPDLMSCSDVFVHASIKPEPFGMVILEAMAARKPVVATDSGGPVEILNNGEFGILVPPRDGNAITAACLRYLDDDDFRERTIEEAYERVMRDFHISRTVRRTTEFFGRVLSKSESRVTGTRYSEAKTGESMQKEDPL